MSAELNVVARLYKQGRYRRASVRPGFGAGLVLKSEADAVIAELRAAVASHQGVAVPAGWALVPVEPTLEMQATADEDHGVTLSEPRAYAVALYAAMLAAAPQPPAVKEAAPAPSTLSDDAVEGLELLDGLMKEIRDSGNYSQEATLTFLGQIRQCFSAAGNSQGLDAGRWAKWIVRRGMGLPDHACAQCVPHSDVLKPGFVCVYHQAAAVAPSAPVGGSHG